MTLQELMFNLGFQDVGSHNLSQYRPTYKHKLIEEKEVTITGFYIQIYDVVLQFTEKAYNEWNRRFMQETARKKFRQRIEFGDEKDLENGMKEVRLIVTIRRFERRK